MSEENKREILDQAQALNDQELTDVAGGARCYCAIGGGGTADQRGEKTCACAVYGQGDYNSEGTTATGANKRCTCYVGGGGINTNDGIQSRCTEQGDNYEHYFR